MPLHQLQFPLLHQPQFSATKSQSCFYRAHSALCGDVGVSSSHDPVYSDSYRVYAPRCLSEAARMSNTPRPSRSLGHVAPVCLSQHKFLTDFNYIPFVFGSHECIIVGSAKLTEDVRSYTRIPCICVVYSISTRVNIYSIFFSTLVRYFIRVLHLPIHSLHGNLSLGASTVVLPGSMPSSPPSPSPRILFFFLRL